LSLLLSALPISIIYIDQEERVLFANDFHLHKTGRTPRELYGRTVRDILGDHYERISPYLERALRGEQVSFEVRMDQGAAGERDSFAKLVPRIDVNGTVIGILVALEDITDREHALQALRDSEACLRIATENAGLFTWLIDIATDTVTYSSNAANVLGFSPPRLASEGFPYTDADDREQILRHFGEAVASGKSFDLEYRRINPDDGSVIWLRSCGTIMDEGADGARLMVGITQNVTERKHAEEALRRSEERLRLATEAAKMYTWHADLRTGEISADTNAGAIRSCPTPKSLAEAMSLVHPDDRDRVREERERAIRTGEPFDNEYRFVNPNTGEVVWVRTSGIATRDNDGNPERLLGITQNITAEIQAEQELRRSREELEQRVIERTDTLRQSTAMLESLLEERARLLRQLVQGQEEERRRIARELHDEMGQHLTALRIGLELLDSPRDSNAIDRLKDIMGRIDRGLDRLALELRPAALDDVGLDAAASQLTEEFTDISNIEVDLHICHAAEKRLPSAVETTLYRILQEALTNVWKHSSAKKVSVIVDRRGDQVQMIIEDDGCGFDPDDSGARRRAGTHFGLLGMRERVAVRGGTFTLESSPGNGTSLFIRLPVAFPPESPAGQPRDI
jgi:PAS domain S-box-containing protein